MSFEAAIVIVVGVVLLAAMGVMAVAIWRFEEKPKVPGPNPLQHRGLVDPEVVALLERILDRQISLTEKLVIPPPASSPPTSPFPEDEPADPEFIDPTTITDWTDDLLPDGPQQIMGQIPHPPAFPE